MSDEYPRALFRAGEGDDHQSWEGALLVAGAHKVDTLIVNNEDEELAADAEGWKRKPEECDASAPRRGRPPKLPE